MKRKINKALKTCEFYRWIHALKRKTTFNGSIWVKFTATHIMIDGSEFWNTTHNQKRIVSHVEAIALVLERDLKDYGLSFKPVEDKNFILCTEIQKNP